MRTYCHSLIPLSLFAAVALLRAQDAAPVGVILAAQSSFVQLPGIETQFEAKPGMALRPVYPLRSANGRVRFAFCPANTQQTLLPGHELIVPQSSLPQTPGLF